MIQSSLKRPTTPPKSRLKRWELVRIVAKSKAVDIAAMRAAAKIDEEAGIK